MTKSRLEAFSDGVLAIIITIMVLQMKIPSGDSFKNLIPMFPMFLTYLGSFIYAGIYWNNHHHLFQTVQKVNGKILWSNLNLLFWLSFLPITTEWMGANHFHSDPVALYGIILILSAIAFKILVHTIVKNEGKNSVIAKIYKNEKKENLSILMYAFGISAAFINPYIGICFYLIPTLIWLIPDLRVEHNLKRFENKNE